MDKTTDEKKSENKTHQERVGEKMTKTSEENLTKKLGENQARKIREKLAKKGGGK